MHPLLFLRRHFIPAILSALLAMIAFLLFVDVSQSNEVKLERERISPYVLCTQGKTILQDVSGKNIVLEAQQKQNVSAEDRIRTLASSAATIFWADGSVTRLWEKTNISLLELRTDTDGSTQVEFSLKSGKTWTNLARALDPDSYFKERFDDDQKVAAVRWTVFEVNNDLWYLYTAAHAVTVQDQKWSYLADIPTGKAINLRGDPKEWVAALDNSWQKANQDWDTALLRERYENVRKRLEHTYGRPTRFTELQDQLRAFLGLRQKQLPIRINTSGSWILVELDMEKIHRNNAPQLIALYETISNLDPTPETLESKIRLREAILQTLPEKNVAAYRESFSRSTLFDSWDATRKDLPESTELLRKHLKEYLDISGQGEDLLRLEQALPQSRIKEFNRRASEWKTRWYESLSDPDWFKNTFISDSDKIDTARRLINTTGGAIRNVLEWNGK